MTMDNLLPNNFHLLRLCSERYASDVQAYLLYEDVDRELYGFQSDQHPLHWYEFVVQAGKCTDRVACCSWGWIIHEGYPDRCSCHPMLRTYLHEDWEPVSALEMLVQTGHSINYVLRKLQSYIALTTDRKKYYKYLHQDFCGLTNATPETY